MCFSWKSELIEYLVRLRLFTFLLWQRNHNFQTNVKFSLKNVMTILENWTWILRELILSSRRCWGHEPRPKVTRASVNIVQYYTCVYVHEVRLPKPERHFWSSRLLKSSCLGKNYLVRSDIFVTVNWWPKTKENSCS